MFISTTCGHDFEIADVCGHCSPTTGGEHQASCPLYLISEAHQTMIASERVLIKDWDQPDEDKAWGGL